jgi:hypothetical protein
LLSRPTRDSKTFHQCIDFVSEVDLDPSRFTMARTHLTHPFAATAISSLAVCTLLGVSSASAHEGCALHAHATGSAAATVKSSKKSPEERSKETLNGVSTAKDKSVAQKAATRSATTIRQASQQDALTVATGPSIEALHGHSTAFFAVPSGIPEEIDIEIPLDGRMETLRLFRASMRTADAKLYVDDGSGGLREEVHRPHKVMHAVDDAPCPFGLFCNAAQSHVHIVHIACRSLGVFQQVQRPICVARNRGQRLVQFVAQQRGHFTHRG